MFIRCILGYITYGSSDNLPILASRKRSFEQMLNGWEGSHLLSNHAFILNPNRTVSDSNTGISSLTADWSEYNVLTAHR